MGNELSTGSSASSSSTTEDERRKAIRRMDGDLQKKLGKGVAHNLKLVVRGERGSGKSALLNRLKGQAFTSSVYEPTSEIQTATINWSAKEEGEVVKVEVWDVVDKGLGRRGSIGGDKGGSGGGGGGQAGGGDPDALAGIPLDLPAQIHHAGGSGSHSFGVLDATILDVWKGAHGGLFLINPFSATALSYLQKQLAEVPVTIPVLLLLNFRDLLPDEQQQQQGESEVEKGATEADKAARLSAALHRPVHVQLEALQALAAEERARGRRTCHAFACSMQNCFGLTLLYAYINLPFLAMKEDGLRRQLEQTRRELAEATQDVEGAMARESWKAYVAKLGESKEKRAQALPVAEREGGGGEERIRPGASAQSAAPVSKAPTAPLQSARASSGGVEEHKSSSSFSSSSSSSSSVPAKHRKVGRRTPASPSFTGTSAQQQQQPPPQSLVSEAGLADVDDFKFQPKEAKERSELDLFLADGEGAEEEEEQQEEERREAERRRQSLTSCLKPGSLVSLSKAQRRAAGMLGVGNGAGGRDEGEDEDEDENGEGEEDVVVAEEGEQRYVGLKPVTLSSRPLSSSSSGLPETGEADTPSSAATKKGTPHTEGMQKEQNNDDNDDDDFDLPAGLPGGNAAVPDDFSSDDEGGNALSMNFKSPRAMGMGSSTGTGSKSRGLSSSLSSPAAAAAPLATATSTSTNVVLSEEARAAIAATMQELGGKVDASEVVLHGEEGAGAAEGERRKHRQHEKKKSSSSSSSRRKHKKKSSGGGLAY